MSLAEGNFYAALGRHFVERRDQRALWSGDDRAWSFGDLEDLSARMAALLSAQGLKPGDRVSVLVEKSPAALCLYLACLRAGAVFHPLNPAYTEPELAFFFGDARPRLVVSDPKRCESVRRHAEPLGAQVHTLDAAGRGTIVDAAASCAADGPVARVDGSDLAALLYSSGTTGRPKGIMLSHDNLASNARTLVRYWGFTEDDVLLHALPIFHVHGLFVAVHCALLSGATMRWLPRFDVEDVLESLPLSTVMMGVPTYYVRLLAEERFSAALLPRMRLFISGSAPLLPETFREFEQRTGQRILERYGMSETGMNTSNPLHGERRCGSVGPALPGVDLRIVGEDDAPLPAGEVGRIQVRGPNVFRGYWGMPRKTAEDFSADGFFETGDQGYLDKDGYLSIVGRAKDLVISGGLNVYPREVEQVLDALPGVRETAVIGVPHPDFGEAVVAVAVASGEAPDCAALRSLAAERLAGYKVPKAFVFVEELPRNTMGKVLKGDLRRRFESLFVATADGAAV